MNKRQAVIKAIELHLDKSKERSCSECPYEHDEACLDTLFGDVFELLKAQEQMERENEVEEEIYRQ